MQQGTSVRDQTLLLLLLLLLLLSCFRRVRLCVTPKTAAHQPPLSTGFSRQEYWSELPFPSPTKHYIIQISSPPIIQSIGENQDA